MPKMLVMINCVILSKSYMLALCLWKTKSLFMKFEFWGNRTIRNFALCLVMFLQQLQASRHFE